MLDRMVLVRPMLTLALAALAACPGEVPPREHPDAKVVSEDAPQATVDARMPAADAAAAADAGQVCADARPGDGGVGCTLPGGTMGVCIDVAACAALGDHVSTPGHCPGSANIQCCTVASPQMAVCDATSVPEPNIGLAEEPGAGGCPAGMVRVGDAGSDAGSDAGTGFCIDRFEAALEVVNADDTTSPWSPYFNPGAHRVVARSWRGAVPQGYITEIQASAACVEAGKRLCSDTEWLRACRGPASWTFPYGETRETGVCNDHRSEHPAVELFGSVTNLTSPCINELHDTVDRTGDRAGCISAEGVFDMMGNLHEWTANPSGTFRGGFYVDTVENGPGCLYVTTAHDTAYDDYSTGFRCCS